MGPEASAYLYTTLINNSIKYFHAVNNDDFPEIILYSIPVPDFISNCNNSNQALQMLKKRVIDLNKISLSCLSMACNTAHLFFDKLQSISSNKFISMIDEVSFFVSKDKKKIVGIMGTPSTIKSGLYQSKLAKYNIQSVVPTSKELKILEKVIRNVLKGKKIAQDQKKLLLISDSLKKRGAEGIILGCTELPLIFPGKYALTVYNSVEILAMVLLQKYYKQNTI